MKDQKWGSSGLQSGCLTAADLYLYVARQADPGAPEGDRIPKLESHLALCPYCRAELAEVLSLLHPENEAALDAEPPLSQIEIHRTVDLIRKVGEREALQRARRRRLTWTAAAAAVLVGLVTGVFWLYRLQQTNHEFALAKASLEEFYAAKSPNGLRLDLPFQPATTKRELSAESSTEQAKVLFIRLLANRDYPAAHLGLAAVYLSEQKYDSARNQFDAILNERKDHIQALVGRGVTAFEQAKRVEDPIECLRLLRSSLGDFEAAIRLNPKSLEARYNRIFLLYETGRHQEALREIDAYLAQDADSPWAGKLRDLATQIRLVSRDASEDAASRAAREHDLATLKEMVRIVPRQVPNAILFLAKMSLRQGNEPAAENAATAADFRWGAENLENEYSVSSGDPSWKALLNFYHDLSPPQRSRKRELDLKFDELRLMQSAPNLPRIIKESAPLEQQYFLLQDYWQLVNIHHLRGNSFLYQAEFRRAESEYHDMLQFAEKTGTPELRARAWAGLIAAYAHQKFPVDREQGCIHALMELGARPGFEYWAAFATKASALMHKRLNQREESIREFSSLLGFAYRTSDQELLQTLYQNLADLMNSSGRRKEAQDLLAEAAAMMSIAGRDSGKADAPEVAAASMNLPYIEAQAALDQGKYEFAEIRFRKALDLNPRPFLEVRCRCLIGLAQTHLARKEYSQAGSLLDESAKLADKGPFLELAWQAAYLRGKRARGIGDVAGARKYLTDSVEMLERMRSGIQSLDSRLNFFTRRFDPYRELVSLLYHEMHDGQKAREIATHAKSMTLLEYLDGSKIADHAPSELEQDPRTVAIEYFFTPTELLAIISGSNRNEIVALKVSAVEIESQVRSLLSSVTGGDEASFQALSRKLYDELIGPILQAGGQSAPRLLIFPDGPLHLLPFGGLMNSRSQFLLESQVISYAPSSKVLRHCLSLERGSAATERRSVVLIDGTDNLSGASAEISSLLAIYKNRPTIVTAQDVSRAAGLVRDAEIIHFAGHARMMNHKPALMLGPPVRPSYVDVSAIQSWQLHNNRLVTLAACGTGLGPQADGDVPWGLVPAFLNAGAPALLVSLMPVDDADTALLSARFYELLSAGNLSKGEALQQAQVSLLKRARVTGRLNPASWIPYVLIGDPR